MTSEQLRALKADIPLVTDLFANGVGSDDQRGWSDPSDHDFGARVINWSEGIPPDYAMPYQNSGKKILRKDVNTIGNLATRELYLLQHGGYHTFDERVAKAIGGYPYGAFLDWYQPSTGWLRKVMCVKEGGNCFTPIDDVANGVDSGEPHWKIVDVFDRAAQTSNAGDIKTRSVDVPNKMLLEFGGFGLQIPSNTEVKVGETVKSDPWTAPFDALITIPLLVSDFPWANGDALKNPNITNHEVATGQGYFRGFIEVLDDSGRIEIDLQSYDISIYESFMRSKVETRGYKLCPRMYVKKGTELRLCYQNKYSETADEIQWAVLRFEVKEVL